MNKEKRVKKIVRVVVIFNIGVIVLLCIVFKYFNYNFNNIIINIIVKTGIIISLSLLLVWLINNLLWKCKFLNINSCFFDKIPNLNGKWKGIIINTKDNEEQQANITIEQTYLNIFITTEVERGNSITYCGELIKVNGNNWKLIWTWHSNSIYDGKEFSGTDIVDVISDDKLEGIYFTNANVDERGCTSGIFKAKKLK
jgi:small nuclear ribonucleoprotein (snRNP)-like protein